MRFSWNCLLSVEVEEEQHDRKLRRISVDILLTVAGYETETGTAVFSDCCCLFSRRQEFRFFPFACTSTLSCCSQQRFHWYVSHPLIQENRQFGSKMTDSKYFTTTKKGMMPHTCILFPSENHRWKNCTMLVMRYAFLVISTLFEWNVSGNCPFSKMFSRKQPAAFRFINRMVITSVSKIS